MECSYSQPLKNTSTTNEAEEKYQTCGGKVRIRVFLVSAGERKSNMWQMLLTLNIFMAVLKWVTDALALGYLNVCWF